MPYYTKCLAIEASKGDPNPCVKGRPDNPCQLSLLLGIAWFRPVDIGLTAV
jgi:hypothetical protein